MAGGKSTLAGGDKERKKEKRRLRTFFFSKLEKGGIKNLWTWPAEMSQLNNREIKVCNGLPRIDSCGIAVVFFFFFLEESLVQRLSTRINIYDTFYYHRNWVDGWSVEASTL